MARWLISVPVWGPRYVEIFCATALPALTHAIQLLRRSGQEDVKLVVHTDSPGRVKATADQTVLETRPVPAGLRDWDCFSQSHREVISMACVGDVVVPMAADNLMGEQALVYCANVLANPQIFAIACAVPRALAEGQLPGPGDGVTLMDWMWKHRHPITQASLWPDGDAADLSRTYYENGNGAVVTRVCLPHPIAFRVDGRDTGFVPTIDVNFLDHFDRSEIHVALNCADLAIVELSPRNKEYQKAPRTMKRRLDGNELRIPAPHQRWFLGHRIMIVGDQQDCGDGAVVEKIMATSGGWP